MTECYTAFPICRDPCALNSVLSTLALIPAARTPSANLNFLLRVCSELCRTFPGEEIGGEELMRLLALVLLRSPVGLSMPGEAAFIADLVPEGVLRGESGYVLATLQSAIDFISQL
jgi:hypothetical protein